MPNVICFSKRYGFRSFCDKEEEHNVYAAMNAHPHAHKIYLIRDTQRASELARAQRINVSGRMCQSDSLSNK